MAASSNAFTSLTRLRRAFIRLVVEAMIHKSSRRPGTKYQDIKIVSKSHSNNSMQREEGPLTMNFTMPSFLMKSHAVREPVEHNLRIWRARRTEISTRKIRKYPKMTKKQKQEDKDVRNSAVDLFVTGITYPRCGKLDGSGMHVGIDG
jgi:hypothetical protein